MTDGPALRSFLRLVLAIAIIANMAAAGVLGGERGLREFAVASGLDRSRHQLSDEVAIYGTAIQTLRARLGAEAVP